MAEVSCSSNTPVAPTARLGSFCFPPAVRDVAPRSADLDDGGVVTLITSSRMSAILRSGWVDLAPL